MPQCRLCERVLPSAEVRRTPLGYVCKDNKRGTRCHQRLLEFRKVRRRTQRRFPFRVVFLDPGAHDLAEAA